MPKKTKTSYTSSDIIELLKTMKTDYKNDKAGHRQFIRQMLSTAMTLVLVLRGNTKKRIKLSKTIGTAEVENLHYHVVRYIMGAKTESQKKLADKRARAMVHLRDVLGVPPKDFDREIRGRGGLEKLARLAAQHRREQADGRVEEGNGGEQVSAARHATASAKVASNDNEPTLNARVDRKAMAKLSGFKKGTELTLYAVKLKDGIEITRVFDRTKKASA